MVQKSQGQPPGDGAKTRKKNHGRFIYLTSVMAGFPPLVELRNELFKDSRVMTYLETLDIDVMQSEPREISGRHGAMISVIRSTPVKLTYTPVN